MAKDIEQLTVKDLLEKSEYRIPIYQRNYTWGVEETTQLIQDIVDYAKDDPDSNYYIGNLIVFPRFNNGEGYYETIDGQQRVTTLSIIACSIRAHKPVLLSWYKKINVSFDHRENSNFTLNAIYKDPSSRLDDDKVNVDILGVYNKLWSIIERICRDKELDLDVFVAYLLKQVIILRIEVPKETNLNHYFEIMNSRGEQLEQHEIIKAKLMDPIKDDNIAMATFNLIWEACSNMDRYVHMSFYKEIRITIFDNNGTGKLVSSFDEISSNLTRNIKVDNSDENDKSLSCLFNEDEIGIPYKKPWEDTIEKDVPESYHSIISFPNFLLHILKIMFPNNSEIALDDKKLLKIFKHVIEQSDDQKAFAKNFIVTLLDLRVLFDKYIIKRNQEKWSLKQLLPQKSQKDKYYYKDTFSKDADPEEIETPDNRMIIMLLSMFHVSAPTPTNKHWMNAALNYIYHHRNASSSDYSEYLFKLAKAYMLDRYLAIQQIPFETIIYSNKTNPVNIIKLANWNSINIDDSIQVGESVENFVFNFYDYLLWLESNKTDFDYSYRTSVEHFYPQHPTNQEPMEYRSLHSFGNLCLISRGMNSKFTNNLPGAKNENFGSDLEMKSYSLKLQEMMNCIKRGNKWDENEISKKEQEAKELFVKYLN